LKILTRKFGIRIIMKSNCLRIALLAGMALLSQAAYPATLAQTVSAEQGDDASVPFYVWNNKIPARAGTLLRQEPLETGLGLANAAQSLRLLYSSTDPLNSNARVVTSAAIFLPKGTPPTGGWPLIAWAHGKVGTNDACAPSRNPRGERDAEYLNAWLAQGYAVVAADYIGLGTAGGHAWMGVPFEGYAVLDSIRAATNGFKDVSEDVVIVGQSQGGHAAISATALQPQYAPDIRLKATVATGVPGSYPFLPDSKPTDPIAPWAFAPGNTHGINPRAIASYLAIAPDAFNPDDYLTDEAKKTIAASRVGCGAPVARPASASLQGRPSDWLRKSLDEWAAKMVAYERYPTLRFSKPLFVGTGLSDTTVLPKYQYSVMKAACQAGTMVEGHFYPEQTHGSALNASLKDSIPFVRRAFAGERIHGNCADLTPPTADAPVLGNAS
jgi:dienelactone hydrolase